MKCIGGPYDGGDAGILPTKDSIRFGLSRRMHKFADGSTAMVWVSDDSDPEVRTTYRRNPDNKSLQYVNMERCRAM